MIKFVIGMFFGMWLATYGIDNVVNWMQDTVQSATELTKEQFVKQIDKDHFKGE